MFKYDSTGVKESGDFSPMPEGEYLLRIKGTEEKINKNGDPMVNVTLVVEEGEYKGRKIWHNVSFPKKDSPGAGMAKHWLHAIGQPYEGKVNVDPSEWAGVIRCDIKVGEYNGKKKNEISNVHLPEDDGSEGDNSPATEKSEDEVPF